VLFFLVLIGRLTLAFDEQKVINSKSIRNLKDEYLKQATQVIQDPNILVNVVSRRVKQLKHGSRPLVESLEKLNPEDIALREIIEGKITYQLYSTEDSVL
jgi:DNA-directed RNA polymerase subunit omega